MKIQITNRFNSVVLFEHTVENNTLALTLAAAVKAGANLTDADLTGADLTDADLTGANLTDAKLTDANLTGANLTGANLARANLTDADLARTNLVGANLVGANLSGEVLNKAPISLLNLQWSVLITDQYMRIGCQRHTHCEWHAFTDAEINAMEKNALSFWKKWKVPLLTLCDSHHEDPIVVQQVREVESVTLDA